MEAKEVIEAFAKKVTPGLDSSMLFYRNAADREKKEFLNKSKWTRSLGLLASTIIFISTLRLDQILLDALHVNPAVATKIGSAFGASGLLMAFLAYWFGRGLTERGHLRAWIRYSLTAQKLEEFKTELELIAPKFDVTQALSGAPAELTDLTKSLFSVADRIRTAPTAETEQWALDAMSDLTTFVQSARDAAKVAESIHGQAPAH